MVGETAELFYLRGRWYEESQANLEDSWLASDRFLSRDLV
jgi:hypothetical protein